MSQPKKDDTIDLVEMFEALWAGKWIIIAFAGIALAFGFSLNFYKKINLPSPHFVVYAPYSINLSRPLDSQICREQFNFVSVNKNFRNLDCVVKRVSSDLKNIAKSQWSKNTFIEREWAIAGLNLDSIKSDCPAKFCLEMITRSPLDPKSYNGQLHSYNQVLTESIINEVEKELSYQFQQNADLILSSEAYAENAIKLTRLLNVIEIGKMAINFEEVVIKKVVPPEKGKLIMAIYFALGGFLGCALVLIRDAISRRRNKVG